MRRDVEEGGYLLERGHRPHRISRDDDVIATGKRIVCSGLNADMRQHANQYRATYTAISQD